MLRKILSFTVIVATGYWSLVIAKYYFGDILYKETQLTGKLELSLAAKNLFPDNPHFLLQAARLSAQNNLPREAIAYSKLALTTSPGEINFYKLASQIYTTLATKKPVYLSDSLQTLQKAESLAPTDPVIPYQIANILVAIDKPQEAQKYYQRALELKPNYDLAMLKLSKLYKEQKNYPEAKKYLDSAIKINPLNSAYQN